MNLQAGRDGSPERESRPAGSNRFFWMHGCILAPNHPSPPGRESRTGVPAGGPTGHIGPAGLETYSPHLNALGALCPKPVRSLSHSKPLVRSQMVEQDDLVEPYPERSLRDS